MIGIDVPLSVLLSLTVASLACYAALELAGSVRGAGTRAGVGDMGPPAVAPAGHRLAAGRHRDRRRHLGWPMLRALPGRIGLDARWLVTAAAVACPLALAGMLLLGRRAGRLTRALQQARLQLQYLGTHDMLTGLPNRQQLAEQIAIRGQPHRPGHRGAHRRRARRHAVRAGLDNFRAINDSLGHAVGDDVLKACAQRCADGARGRRGSAPGGDQFGVLMHSRPGRLEAAAIATALRQCSAATRWCTMCACGSAPAWASPCARPTGAMPNRCCWPPMPPCSMPSAPAATRTASSRSACMPTRRAP